ncbi:MAG: toll/interleukin-1 receptor domain-containing protein [Pseudomonadota bacterium]
MNYDAFISHASEDKHIARLLRGYLRSHNIHSWFDVDHVEPTEPMEVDKLNHKFTKAIENSDFFLFLISKHSLKKKWPRLEFDYALAQRNINPETTKMIGIIIDETSPEDLPEWISPISYRSIYGAFAGLDILDGIRDQIGKSKATYISRLEPHFIKQVRAEKLASNLRKALSQELDFWYINGGFSIRQKICPTLEELLEKDPGSTLTCRFMFLDSVLLNDEPDDDYIAEFEDYLHNFLGNSNFFQFHGQHHELVNDSIAAILEMKARYKNFDCTIKLSDRIPAGRFILSDTTGFFTPFVSDTNDTMPIFIFDERSPFFSFARRHFEKGYQTARQIYPKDT